MFRLFIPYTLAVFLLSPLVGRTEDEAARMRVHHTYSSNVTLHEAPSDFSAPATNSRRSSAANQYVPPSSESFGGDYKAPKAIPPPPRPVAREKKKDDNWLSQPSDKDKPEPSGWGWLADAVSESKSKNDENKNADNDHAADDADNSDSSTDSGSTNGLSVSTPFDQSDRQSGVQPYNPLISAVAAADIYGSSDSDKAKTDDAKPAEEVSSPEVESGINISDQTDHSSRIGPDSDQTKANDPLAYRVESFARPIDASGSFGTSPSDRDQTVGDEQESRKSLFDTGQLGAEFTPALSSPTDLSRDSGSGNYGMAGSSPAGASSAGIFDSYPSASAEPASSRAGSGLDSSSAAPKLNSEINSSTFETTQPRALPW